MPRPADLQLDFTARYVQQGHAYPKWPVIINTNNCLEVKMFEWGVVAPYMKGETIEQMKDQRKFMLNIRSERILGDKSSIWYRIRKQRCLVLATGFYEFRDVGWKKKVPYYIRLKNRPQFLLPGLYNYSHVPNADGELVGTFALGIRKANEVMRKIHNSGDNPDRMPLMLPPELEKEWVNQALTDSRMQEILDYEMPSEALEYWPVKSLYRVDGLDPHILDVEEYEGLPPL
jgi:putative SOS response-associated peptidase YedK